MWYTHVAMPFQQLTDVKKPRFVIDQLLQSIRDRSLSAGDRLPSEAKLAELTGVGRTSVREALAALRLMGVIETRVGDGSYVAVSVGGGAIPSGIAEEIAGAISKSEEALQLQEARAVFEAGMVRLAAERWSPEKATEFEELLARMADAAESEGYAHYIQLHRDFHLMLAQATDNTIVESTAKSFLEYMDHEGWQDMERQFYLPNRGEILNESVELHRGIVEALASGDGAVASQRVHDHFQRYEEGGNGA